MAKNCFNLSYLLAACTVLATSGLLSACKQPMVPSDLDMIKTYRDNRKAYDQVAKLVLAEGNQKFTVARGQAVTYQDNGNPVVSGSTGLACQQIMRRTFCLAVRKNGGTVYFIYYENSVPEYFRSKSIVFDRDEFKDPVWTSRTGETFNIRYVPIEPKWKLEYKYEKHGR